MTNQELSIEIQRIILKLIDNDNQLRMLSDFEFGISKEGTKMEISLTIKDEE